MKDEMTINLPEAKEGLNFNFKITKNTSEFFTSGLWAKPKNVEYVTIMLIGAGGCSGSDKGGSSGSVFFGKVAVSDDVEVVIGKGRIGESGEDSKFGDLIAKGGSMGDGIIPVMHGQPGRDGYCAIYWEEPEKGVNHA